MAQMTRGGTGPVADYHRTKGNMETRLLKQDEKARRGSTNAFGVAVPRGPSVDVEKTDAAAFTSKVDAPPVAGPRRNMMPVGVGALDAAPAPARAPRQPAAGGSLKKGVYNSDDVRALQTSLKDVAAFLGDKSLDPGSVDADFGGNTERAVKAFQKRFGLTETGVVDAGTMREIQTIQANLARGGASGADTAYRLGETDIMGESAVNRGTAPKPSTTAPQSIKVGSPQFTALLGAQLSFDQIDGLLASGLIDEDIATALKAKLSGYPES